MQTVFVIRIDNPDMLPIVCNICIMCIHIYNDRQRRYYRTYNVHIPIMYVCMFKTSGEHRV